MRKLKLGALALIVGGMVAAGPLAITPAVAGTTGYHHCSGTFGPQGQPGQGFFSQIRAKHVSCPTARTVIRIYLHRGFDKTRIVRGFRCHLRLLEGPRHPDGVGYLRCAREDGRQVIRSVGHP